MKAEILKLLREADGYVSGQQLCEKFGVSRTAVWKVIRQLQEEGYQVEAVRNKGYHIVDSPDVMTKEELDSLMDTQWAGRNIVYYDSVDSTNLRIKQMGDEGAPEGTLAVADKQTAGRGRRGRSWDSPSGSSIYMSLLLRPKIEPDQAPMLTLVMALSVAEGIMDCGDSCGNPDVKIKWPNDIVYQGKKLCGILTEMSADMDQIHYVIVGIGINVQMTDFPKEIQNTATSLKLVTGKTLLRNELLAKVLEEFEVLYEQFVSAESLKNLKAEYESRLANKDNRVNVLAPSGAWQGICLGIKEDGALLVQREDGKVEEVIAGEVSVRGIYGYV